MCIYIYTYIYSTEIPMTLVYQVFLSKKMGSQKLHEEQIFSTEQDSDPPPPWPQHGSIEFQNVFLRYRPELPTASGTGTKG